LGFDIKSFDADETPRCIGVKNVSGGNRFFSHTANGTTARRAQTIGFISSAALMKTARS
jgi:hypothetical protein